MGEPADPGRSAVPPRKKASCSRVARSPPSTPAHRSGSSAARATPRAPATRQLLAWVRVRVRVRVRVIP